MSISITFGTDTAGVVLGSLEGALAGVLAFYLLFKRNIDGLFRRLFKKRKPAPKEDKEA